MRRHGVGSALVTVTILLLGLAAFGARAEDACQVAATPKQLEAAREGEPQLLAVSARPSAAQGLVTAALTLDAPAGITAVLLDPPPSLPTSGDIAWKVRVQAGARAPPKGEIIVGVSCDLVATSERPPTTGVSPITRLSFVSVPFTVRSATQAFGKLKLRVEPMAEPVNERRAGTLGVTIENQGEQDVVDASVAVAAPAFLRMDPDRITLGRIAAGATTTVSFRVSQVDRADPGAAAPTVTLRARAAGETAEGVVTVAAPVALSVLGLSDALKLLQVPSFLLLPGALFLLTCGLIWDIRKPGGEFPMAWSKPAFWVVAISLSIVAAVLYPWVTGLFGTPREYLSAYTLDDVMLVWFSSIVLALPAYAIAAVVRNARIRAAARAEAAARRQREISGADDALTVLRKLAAMDALPNGQVFPVVVLSKGGDEQRVLLTQAAVADGQWVIPRARIDPAPGTQKVDWTAVDAALTLAGGPAGVAALLALCATPGAELRAEWMGGELIDRPTLWPTAEWAPAGNTLPLIDR